jgi:ABC-2 type transport system ATP-binding protein
MRLERPLAALQENMVKIQLALPDGKELPDELDVLHESRTGRLRQLILRGSSEALTARLAACEPFFMDVLPLSLEEILIYELGGEDHEIKNILL